MTQERVAGVQEWGRFTPRQAAFITTVLLNGGVCLPRQYDAFAGIASGRATREFFERLTQRGLATAYPCARSNARIYHVQHRRLYELVGEPNSRYRRRGNVTHAIERLMVLDAVLAMPHLRWLATEREKVDHFVKRYGIEPKDLPRVTFGTGLDRTTRCFVDKLPIGVGALGEVTFMYVLRDLDGRAFRSFLDQHRQTLKRLPRWRVLLVASSGFGRSIDVHRRALQDFCGTPLPCRIADEFKWYCQARRAADAGSFEPKDEAERSRYGRARRAFAAPRFYSAYRRWLTNGDASLVDLTATHFHDAWRRDGGVLDTVVLPHVYAHLVPLARTA